MNKQVRSILAQETTKTSKIRQLYLLGIPRAETKKQRDARKHVPLNPAKSPYVGITQIRYTGRNAQFPLSLSASSPRFNYIFIIAWPSRVVNICPTVRSEEKGCSHLIFQYAGIVTLTNKDMTTVRSAF